MLLQLLPLLLLWAVLGSLVSGGRPCSSRHSLCYSYLKVSEPSKELPQFLSMVHLDDHPIARYDILNGKTVPLVSWMTVEEMKAPERMFRADLEWISKLNHQTGGLHTWQVMLCCELKEDRSKRGFLHYGYHGMDFISFDKETLRWVAAQPQAEKVKKTWEGDPRWSQGNKDFLEETCIERLRRYLFYQKMVLKKTEPPVGKVTHKVVNDSLQVLICQAFGFYPKEIQATWMRDGEICKYKTLPRNVAPNSDGTYYVWLSIEINPKERHHFWCHLKHEGLQEPLILAFKQDPVTGWLIPVGIVAALILGALIVFVIYKWRRSRKNFCCKVTTHPYNGSQEKVPSQTVSVIEDETQSQPMLQPTITSELSCLNRQDLAHLSLSIPKALREECGLAI
ncbi:major histocompatibility complex class I-related gene protein-like [Erythrolamprus reginae]|uniref:major histocompatibility complex class I-related gene protein-like n=1 Tax=Erythrolamprus reginae TaxID=121349 RepID=UPI00396C86AC